MSDSLTVFGTDYTGVTGIKAKGTGNGTLTYIRPSGTKSISTNGTGIDVTQYASVDVAVPDSTFVVTISYNSTTEMWEPDCTVSELQDAYASGKTIAFTGENGEGVTWFQDDDYAFIYSIATDGGPNILRFKEYLYTAQGIEYLDDIDWIGPDFESPSRTYTPTTQQQTETITYDSSQGYNGIEQVSVTVNAMPTGSAGTPTATKGSVSNHSVSVTPSVTNQTGYITGGTKTGTAVSVSASELVSGTYTVSASGTHDVTNYASASVAAGGATASATKGTVSNHSVTVTPSVTRTAGWVTAGSANGTAVTVSASELVSGNKAITDNGTGIDVTNYSTVSVDVGGSGSSKNVQVAQSTSRATSSTYTSVCSLTCSTAGTYDVYWDCFRSSTGGTSGSQLYVGGSAYGSANTTFTNHAQTNHLTGVSLTKNQTVAVYARSRGSNYYAYCGQLTIVQTA